MQIQNFIAGNWQNGSFERQLSNIDPSTGQALQTWSSASGNQVDQAVRAARNAVPAWSERSLESRIEILRAFASIVKQNTATLAKAIQLEAGKPDWEARQECNAVVSKVELSIAAYQQRCHPFGDGPARTRFKPHGVLGVLGPYNFPAHLPNGHIVPALLAGNTVVFKPSERVPSAGQLLAKFWADAELPDGVFNVVQGDAEVGAQLVEHPSVDGLLFTGGTSAGDKLRAAFASQPEKILALELGGNNPLIAWDAEDIYATTCLIAQSAYVTAGQRCTCARRLIIPKSRFGDEILDRLIQILTTLRYGSAHQTPEVFMGPVISSESAQQLTIEQESLIAAGAEPLLRLKRQDDHTGIVSPGLLDLTPLSEPADREIFGPLLAVRRVETFEDALEEANRTRFGLAAGLLSDDPQLYERFYRHARAGIVNWNTPLTGASGAAPFGGIGISGNHRPSGFFASDYCSYPVASMENERAKLPSSLPPGLIL